jgi:hypothetical protein
MTEKNGQITLRDLFLLGIPENVYMVHETVDVGFIPTAHFSLLDDSVLEDYAALLDAPVAGIQPGAYGPEIVLTGVDPRLLMDLDQKAADAEQEDHHTGDIRM